MEYAKYFVERYKSEDPWQFETSLYEKVRHAAMVEFATAANPQKVLDLGCGEGHFLSRLLTKAPNLAVTGVELVPAAAERCQRRLAAYSARILTQDLLDFLNAGENDLFDTVVCGDVLYYLTPTIVKQVVIPGITRRLSTGGTVVLSYADVNDHDWLLDLFAAGFAVENRVYIKPLQDPPPWPWLVALFRGSK